MTGTYTPARRAEGRIRLAIDRLADDLPFHAAILERFKVEVRPEVGTMGVTVAGDDVLLLHDPGFVLAVSADELAGVLLHEVHHVLFGHVTADPADYPDEWARTVAEEVTANEFVALPLAGEPITLDRVPGLPPMESTRRRYDRLERVRRRGRVGPPAGLAAGRGEGRADGDRTRDLVPSGSGGGPRPARPASPRSSDTERGGAGRAPAEGPGPGELGRTVDDHGVWEEARREPGRSRQAIREAIRGAILEVGPDGLPESLRSEVEALGIGREPRGDPCELQGRRRGRLDWRRLLRRHIGRALEVRPAFDRPPRRFPDLVGIVPGRRRRAARPRVLAVIDTSGSIAPALLESIDAELAGLARRHAVVVAECDGAVRRVYPYRGRLRSVRGRGGTDLRPPLERAFLRTHRADLVVYFTDGAGPAPATRPGPPVIWCLVPGGEAPAPWGHVVRMEEEA